MNQGIQRRLGRAETAVSEQRERMRARVERVVLRMGAELSAAEIDDLAGRLVGTPARIRALRQAGLADDRILERLEHQIDGGEP